MQNVGQSENRNIDKVNVQLDVVKSSTPQSSSSSPAKSETETYSSAPAQYMSDSSESEDDSVSEAEMDEEAANVESSKLLLSSDDPDRSVDPEMQARLEALLEAAGIGKIAGEGKHLADPEVLRRLTSSVSNALDEAAAALTRMRSDQPPPHHRHHQHQDKPTQCGSTATGTTGAAVSTCTGDSAPSLAEACSDGDVGTVRKLLTEGRSVHETTEEGESLLSLACSAGYYELAQVLLAMHASVEDRGIKGDCTPLMEAASAGHVDIVRLLIAHGADVNTVSGSGNTPLMYACAGGHEDCVRALLDHGANVEEHNENGHTPLMEAASAGHVGVAKILLSHGAGINTHSNEFKESALTLACYKGHLDMVRFLLAAGADREHKTDEMHTALMEASMDGHVEVARLLLDSGAQVNMPTDSFESPLTLAACGGHVELAMLLLERGANIEEVNDEGYTPLMEAAREGHEEMVALLLSQGAMINGQTEETQETALTLACCGGFLEVADFLIKAGADLELGASTPLMEASQEGHLDLVRYLINAGCDVHAQTQTGDTALTYACENGHTDVAELLLRAGAPLEHESEGGRTPLMKACRAGHLCTVQFLHQKGADVNRMTANGDHTPLSLACAGGHADVVKFLLACDADPFRKLKDNSSTLIEAAKGGHTAVVQLLLDYPHSVMLQRNHAAQHHPVAPAPVEADAAGLTPAQAAQLGLCVVGGPEGAGRTVVPLGEERGGRCGGCHNKHRNKHKHDTHDHTPDQIRIVDLRENIREKLSKISPPPGFTWEMAGISVKRNKNSRLEAILAQARNKPLPDDRTLLELTETTGPPTLATSALHALDLQFCAQGVTSTPTTPPYPPPQPFPSQTLAATVNQVQLQQMQQPADPQLPPANRTEHLQGHSAPTQLPQSTDELGGSEARELSAVLAYLQREVPSLVALPPTELRSLVLQVMQQKSHEILSGACGGTAGTEESPARRLLAAAEHALTHHHHLDHNHHSINSCGYVRRDTSPSVEGEVIAGGTHTHTTTTTTTTNPNVNINNTKRPEPTLVPREAAPPPPVYGGGTGSTGGTGSAPLPKKKGKRVGARRGGAGDAAGGALDVDNETDSNHDTALTLACAGGHDDLVDLLLARGADIEHRDKKGFTPLILAATAGHEKIVEILLNHGADIEAQSERTKDTPLSLACSGGRYEVVELILSRGANKEHRNVSDYTPLSLAASGGYVNIIRLLLHHQAEINSRTGSKLGISPLMLAAMNGHTAAVRLLLDCGSDINAQIETNRNTALTLACFQGRHEVVSLLLDRKANVEHRAKTGLTPLMEAASGGYVEVGRVLLDKGADVNAPPVPSSRDTALTIAADKGHTKFVELLLQRRAAVEVKNKKGNSPLWLAAHGGHLAVVEMLYAAGADIDSQDNRKVSCLMAAFRKGHTKVVKWMVGVVTQFPSDQEMTRYIWTISDKELLEKCQECVRVIRAAKETQAARANQNATILLEELDAERSREQSRRQAAARRREKKKKKKIEKKEERRKMQSESLDEPGSMCCVVEESEGGEHDDEPPHKEEGDSGIDANSQGSCSSSDVKAPPAPPAKTKKKKKEDKPTPAPPPTTIKKQTDKSKQKQEPTKPDKEPTKTDKKQEKENVAPTEPPPPVSKPQPVERRPVEKKDKKPEEEIKSITVQNVNKYGNNSRKTQVFESTRHVQDEYDVGIDKTKKPINFFNQWEEGKSTSPKSANAPVRREEGWKEVVRKSSVQTISTVEPGCKRVSVASHAISRVIGRAGSNINAIRSATGAHIEVDKQTKGQGERIITIKGSPEATKQAANLIAAMIRDPEADIAQLLPRKVPAPAPIPVVAKPQKQPAPKVVPLSAASAIRPAVRPSPSKVSVMRPANTRTTAPVIPTTPSPAEKRVSSSSPCLMSKVSYAVVGGRGGTFANKVTNTHTTPPTLQDNRPPLQNAEVPSSPVKERTEEEPRTPHRPASLNVQLSPESTSSWSTNEENVPSSTALHINTNPQTSTSSSGGTQEYSLFKDAGGGVWGDAHHHADSHPPQVDVSKAPGYRGGCSPSSRASSHSATPPPPIAPPPLTPHPHSHTPHPHSHAHTNIPHTNVNTHHTMGSTVNTMDMSGLNRNGPMYQDNSRNGHNMMQQVAMSSGVGLGIGYVGVESRLNPRAPDFSQRPPLIHHKHNAQLFGASSTSPAASSANLSTLLMQYQPKHVPPPPPHLQYQALLDRGMGGAGAVGAVPGSWEEEERKPRPIGTERAWKMTPPDDWGHLTHVNPHLMPDHDRYQQMGAAMVGPHMSGSEYGVGANAAGVGAVGGVSAGSGATAAALSLMQALPLQYHMPPNHDHHWDQHHHHNDNQSWSKWTH